MPAEAYQGRARCPKRAATSRRLANIRRRHLLSKPQIVPSRADLLLRVTIENFCQRTSSVLEVHGHLRLRIDRERIAHPAIIIVAQEPLVRIGEVDPFTVKDVRRRQPCDAVTRHAGEPAIFADELLAELCEFVVDGRLTW